ncbi:hypothetical protein FO519_001505 [Halicephalobus sp. NKZ332]|nr:hypothetical protein FO519_001505 [Halicephalobus sp. NKZ332]
MADWVDLSIIDLESLKQRELEYRTELKQRILNVEQVAAERIPDKVPFFFTDYTGKKGCGCKIPRDTLNEFLKTANYNWKAGAKVSNDGSVGIGLDSAILPVRSVPNLRIVQSTDFFYPIVDDPEVMGMVTVSNVLSDLYATGTTQTDSMLMLLGVASKLTTEGDDVRTRIVGEFISGFKKGCDFANVGVHGGQTVECPWMLLGGVGTAVIPVESLSKLNEARANDVLLLTKPLGIRPIVNAHQWLHSDPERFKEHNLDEAQVRRAFLYACYNMARHNLIAARFLKEFNAHASTDVTGFGILGHADNLAKAQKGEVTFVIEKLPVLPYAQEISKSFEDRNGFKLFDGTAAETSGGLLIALEKEDAAKFIQKLKEFGIVGHIIGQVVKGDSNGNRAILLKENLQIFEETGVTDHFEEF